MKSQDNNLDAYFQKALVWYNQKYLLPLTHRSYAACILVISAVLLGVALVQISKQLPIITPLKYAVMFDDPDKPKDISINPADHYALDPLNSIAKILVENYVTEREKYNYSELQQQIILINAHSTRSIFDQYYDFLKVENQLSPVLRYQDQIKVICKVLYTSFSSNDSAVVQFRTIARDSQDKIIEQICWQADVNFKIDPIVLDQPDGTRFNFLVTGYRVKLIKNEI